MGVRIIEDADHAALYDSVTDVAFGPVFYGLDESECGEDVSAGMQAEAFLKFLVQDARRYNHKVLMKQYKRFRDLIEQDGWYAAMDEWEVTSDV